MALIENFARQHAELLQLGTELSYQLNLQTLSGDATKARLLLSTLAGKLKAHLAAEDNILYPRLFNHTDRKVAAVAESFGEEMGSLRSSFEAYLAKWPGASSIQVDATAFIIETRAILLALKRRIDRENNELYVLLT